MVLAKKGQTKIGRDKQYVWDKQGEGGNKSFRPNIRCGAWWNTSNTNHAVAEKRTFAKTPMTKILPM